jgi:hypothetical protein
MRGLQGGGAGSVEDNHPDPEKPGASSSTTAAATALRVANTNIRSAAKDQLQISSRIKSGK